MTQTSRLVARYPSIRHHSTGHGHLVTHRWEGPLAVPGAPRPAFILLELTLDPRSERYCLSVPAPRPDRPAARSGYRETGELILLDAGRGVPAWNLHDIVLTASLWLTAPGELTDGVPWGPFRMITASPDTRT